MRSRSAPIRLPFLALVITGLTAVLLAVAPARLLAQRPVPLGPILVPTDVRVTTDPAGTTYATDCRPGQDLYLHFTLCDASPARPLHRLRARAALAPKVRISENTGGAHGLLLRKHDQRKMPFDEPNVPVGTRYTVRLRVNAKLSQIYDNVVVTVSAQAGKPNERSSKARPFRIQPLVLE